MSGRRNTLTTLGRRSESYDDRRQESPAGSERAYLSRERYDDVSPLRSRRRPSGLPHSTSDISETSGRFGVTGKPASSVSSGRSDIDDGVESLRRRMNETSLSYNNSREHSYPAPSSYRPNPARRSSAYTAANPPSPRSDTGPSEFNKSYSTGSSRAARSKIIIGIDFGTTFSGVAYAVMQPNEQTDDVRVYTVSDWEGRLPGRTTSTKVPTEIAFDEADGDKPYWGFDIPDYLRDKKVKYVKLLLEPDISRKISNLGDLMDPSATSAFLESKGRSPIDVAGAFVKCLWDHAKRQIIRHKGQATWNFAEKVVLFTVPAVWSEKAKHNTYMIAEKAGLASNDISLEMISEPEAAAVAVLKDPARIASLREGDIFVIVDAGGGTVDLTSYRVKYKDPLELEEVIAGDGDVCGATFLDANFQDLLRTRIGMRTFDWLDPFIKERIACDWEDSIRSQYNGEDDQRYALITPGVADNKASKIKNGIMTLQAKDIEPVFKPITDRIVKLVDKQVDALNQERLRPSAIVLVGGLGSNRYLAKQLKQKFGPNGRRRTSGIEIQQPDIAWESVAHGAVKCEILGYGSVVSMRIARYNIGFGVSKRWRDDGRFAAEQKYRDKYSGEYMAKNCVTWALRRGQKLERDKCFETSIEDNWWQEQIDDALDRGDQLAAWTDFIASQENNATENDASQCRAFMSFETLWDPLRFPPERMKLCRSPEGRPYRRVVWRIFVRQSMAGMKVKMGLFDKIVYNDVKVDFHSLPELMEEADYYSELIDDARYDNSSRSRR